MEPCHPEGPWGRPRTVQQVSLSKETLKCSLVQKSEDPYEANDVWGAAPRSRSPYPAVRREQAALPVSRPCAPMSDRTPRAHRGADPADDGQFGRAHFPGYSQHGSHPHLFRLLGRLLPVRANTLIFIGPNPIMSAIGSFTNETTLKTVRASQTSLTFQINPSRTSGCRQRAKARD